MNDVQVKVRSSQTRSNFEVGLLNQNRFLSGSGYDGEFNGGIFIPVGGLKHLKIAITILTALDGDWVTKN